MIEDSDSVQTAATALSSGASVSSTPWQRRQTWFGMVNTPISHVTVVDPHDVLDGFLTGS